MSGQDKGVAATPPGHSPEGGAASASPAKPSVPNAGWFIERPNGPNTRRWYVVFRDDGTAICNSDDHYFTAANPSTFRAWGWVREAAR